MLYGFNVRIIKLLRNKIIRYMMLKGFVEIRDGIVIFRIRSLTKESRESAKVFGKRECIKAPGIYSPFLFKCVLSNGSVIDL